MPKYLIAAGTANIDIAKFFYTHRNMVTPWIKENELANLLEEPADDIVIINTLKNVFDSCKKLGELHSRGVLRSKGLKAKHVCATC